MDAWTRDQNQGQSSWQRRRSHKTSRACLFAGHPWSFAGITSLPCGRASDQIEIFSTNNLPQIPTIFSFPVFLYITREVLSSGFWPSAAGAKNPAGAIKLTIEIIKVREWIPHMGLLTKVIHLKLFLDIVPSSSEDVTFAKRGQAKRLSRNYPRQNGWKCNEKSIYMFGFSKCFLVRIL